MQWNAVGSISFVQKHLSSTIAGNCRISNNMKLVNSCKVQKPSRRRRRRKRTVSFYCYLPLWSIIQLFFLKLTEEDARRERVKETAHFSLPHRNWLQFSIIYKRQLDFFSFLGTRIRGAATFLTYLETKQKKLCRATSLDNGISGSP